MSKRMTQEEYVKRVNDIHSNKITVIGTYVGSGIKIKHKCNICGYEWDGRPNHVLEGHGCANCYGNAKKTNEQFLQKAKENSPYIKIKSKYKNAKSPIDCECVKCGNLWSIDASSVANGTSGCRKCADKLIGENNKTPKQEFLNKLNILFEGNISLISDYTKVRDIMLFKCNNCNFEWNSQGYALLHGKGCPKCNGHSRISHDEFVEQVNKFNKVNVIGKYVNETTNVLVECNECGNQYYGNPFLLKKGVGCKICADKQRGISLRKSNNDFIKELKNINSNIIAVDTYVTSIEKIRFKCLICNNIWSALPLNVLRFSGCPVCSQSHGELQIGNYLNKNNIKFNIQFKFDGLTGIGDRNLSYDFYISKYNLLIEFQGEQHFRPIEYFGGEKQFKIQQEHDKRKRDYAKLHKIKLLEIRYDEDVNYVLENYFKQLNFESAETVIFPIVI